MRIDIPSSLNKKRIVFSEMNLESKVYFYLGYVLSLAISLLHLWIPIEVLITHRVKLDHQIGWIDIGFLTTLVFIGLITLFGVVTRDRLYKINVSSNVHHNKEAVRMVLKKYFKKNIFIDTGDSWTSCRRWKSMGEKAYNRVTVIFSGNTIYFNAEYLGPGNFQSPYHPFFYFLKYVMIKRKVESHLSRIKV